MYKQSLHVFLIKKCVLTIASTLRKLRCNAKPSILHTHGLNPTPNSAEFAMIFSERSHSFMLPFPGAVRLYRMGNSSCQDCLGCVFRGPADFPINHVLHCKSCGAQKAQMIDISYKCWIHVDHMSLLALDLVIPCHVSKCGCVPKIDAQEIFQHFALRGRNMSDQFQDITDTPLDSITWHGQTGLMWLVPCYSQESRKSMPEYQLTDVVPVLFAAPWPVSNFHRIL